MYSSKDSPSGMVFLASSLSTGVGLRVCASPPPDHPMAAASSPLVGFGLGFGPSAKEVTKAGLAAGAKAEAEATRARTMMDLDCKERDV